MKTAHHPLLFTIFYLFLFNAFVKPYFIRGLQGFQAGRAHGSTWPGPRSRVLRDPGAFFTEKNEPQHRRAGDSGQDPGIEPSSRRRVAGRGRLRRQSPVRVLIALVPDDGSLDAGLDVSGLSFFHLIGMTVHNKNPRRGRRVPVIEMVMLLRFKETTDRREDRIRARDDNPAQVQIYSAVFSHEPLPYRRDRRLRNRPVFVRGGSRFRPRRLFLAMFDLLT